MAGATALQDPVTFEDVAISFSLDEWEELTDWQKCLYMEVMKDNYESLVSLGLAPHTSAIPGRGEGPPTGRLQVAEQREGAKHSFLGVGRPGVKQEPGADQDGAGLPCHEGPPEAWDHGSTWEQPVRLGGLLGPDPAATGSAALSPWGTEFKGPGSTAAGEQADPVEFPLGHRGAPRGSGGGRFWPLNVAAPQPSPHEATMLICTQCQKCFPAGSSSPGAPSVAAPGAPLQVCPGCRGAPTEDAPAPADPPSQAGGPPCACVRCLALSAHPRASKEDRPYLCGKCDKRFRYLHEYTWHQKVHSGEKIFRCSKCEKVFRHQQELTWHQRTHTAEWPHKCPTCEKHFRFKQELAWHLKTHSVERPYKCGECEKSFRYKQEFMWHQRAHVGDRPYKCGECEKSFRFKQEFTWHLRSHAGEKTFKCPGCDKSFRYKQEFIWHRRIHMGEQPYPCASCNSTFTCRQEFMRHQRLHDGEKPYQCLHCEKTFRRGSTLIRHRRVHMGEGPFKCAHCERTFGQSANLIKHQRMHTLRPEAAPGWKACLQTSGRPLTPDALSSPLGLKTVSVGALLLLNLPEPKCGAGPAAKADCWEPHM